MDRMQLLKQNAPYQYKQYCIKKRTELLTMLQDLREKYKTAENSERQVIIENANNIKTQLKDLGLGDLLPTSKEANNTELDRPTHDGNKLL